MDQENGAPDYYPMGFRIRGRKVVVAGGGAVAERKILGLLPFRPDLLVVSPALTDRLRSLAASGSFRWEERDASPADLHNAALVFLATNDPQTNAQLAQAASRLGIPANRADCATGCDFIVPSSFERGPIRIAVFTGGASPAIARWVRKRLETLAEPELAGFAEVIARLRAELRARPIPQPLRAQALDSALSQDVLGALELEGFDAAMEQARKLAEAVLSGNRDIPGNSNPQGPQT